MIDPEMKEKIVQRCVDSKEIRKIYDNYIIKEISYKEWVRNRVEWMLHETVEANKELDRLIENI